MKYEENSKILSLLHAHGIEISAKLELPVSLDILFVNVVSYSTGKLTQCVFGHWDVVTCLAYSRHVGLIGGDALVVSGSRDATVLVWRWSEKLQRVAATDREEGGC